MNHSLIDTGFMFAVLDKSDAKHEACSAVFERKGNLLLPEAVLPELAYLVINSVGYKEQTNFMRYLANGNPPLVTTDLQDLKRAAEILEKYADSKIDYVDAMVMAIAERLEIKRILTVDRRDFSIFRPRHCDAFEIIP